MRELLIIVAFLGAALSGYIVGRRSRDDEVNNLRTQHALDHLNTIKRLYKERE